MKTLRQNSDFLEAQMLLDLLKREGIEAQVLGYPGPISTLDTFSLVVADAEFEAASQILTSLPICCPSPLRPDRIG